MHICHICHWFINITHTYTCIDNIRKDVNDSDAWSLTKTSLQCLLNVYGYIKHLGGQKETEQMFPAFLSN